MTAGGLPGLSGHERRRLGWATLLSAGVIVLVIGVNVITRVHNEPDRRLIALIEEGSSLLTVLAAMAVPMTIAVWMRRRRAAMWRAALVVLLGFGAFLLVHVGGFVALRRILFAFAWPRPYSFGLDEAPYEALKDGLGYGLALAGYWRLMAPPPPSDAAPDVAVFDIQDGARLLRVPLSDILAVRSAGNYAEFMLADGRRPLMRTSLVGLEETLGDRGFVRTHRFWLVNARRITGLRPQGSGDHTLELGAVEVPVSRRYRGALAAIRA